MEPANEKILKYPSSSKNESKIFSSNSKATQKLISSSIKQSHQLSIPSSSSSTPSSSQDQSILKNSNLESKIPLISNKNTFPSPQIKEKTFEILLNDENTLQTFHDIASIKRTDHESGKKKLQLNRVVADQSVEKSSEVRNDLKSLQEYCESPEKLEPSEICKYLCESPDTRCQAISYLSSDLIQERMEELEVVIKLKPVERERSNEEDELEDVRKSKEIDEEILENRLVVKSYKKAGFEGGFKKKIISNSLIEHKKAENLDFKDSDNTSVCAKCTLL